VCAGGGTHGGAVSNSIVYYNSAPQSANCSGGTVGYSCTTPDPGGAGNITAEPMLVSASHIASNSPCRGAGWSACSRGGCRAIALPQRAGRR